MVKTKFFLKCLGYWMNRLKPDLKKQTVLEFLGLLDYWMNRLKPDLK